MSAFRFTNISNTAICLWPCAPRAALSKKTESAILLTDPGTDPSNDPFDSLFVFVLRSDSFHIRTQFNNAFQRRFFKGI
jgi:hypothetical protein